MYRQGSSYLGTIGLALICIRVLCLATSTKRRARRVLRETRFSCLLGLERGIIWVGLIFSRFLFGLNNLLFIGDRFHLFSGKRRVTRARGSQDRAIKIGVIGLHRLLSRASGLCELANGDSHKRHHTTSYVAIGFYGCRTISTRHVIGYAYRHSNILANRDIRGGGGLIKVGLNLGIFGLIRRHFVCVGAAYHVCRGMIVSLVLNGKGYVFHCFGQITLALFRRNSSNLLTSCLRLLCNDQTMRITHGGRQSIALNFGLRYCFDAVDYFAKTLGTTRRGSYKSI